MRSFTDSEFASLLVPKTASPQFCEMQPLALRDEALGVGAQSRR